MDEVLHKTYQEVEERHWWFVGRRLLIWQLLKKHYYSEKSAAILDVGCNSGFLVAQLQTAGYDAAGCDISAEAVSYGQNQGRRGLSVCALPQLHYPNGQFDAVLCLDTLEHIRDDKLAIREIGRVLKPGGIAIVTVPAFMFLWGLQDEISHHFRRYTKKELLVKIQAAGFSIERVGYFNFFLFPLIYLVRQAAKIMPLRRRSDFDINNKLVNYVLKNIFLSEIWLLKIISYPFGVSLLVVAKKI
ncbi:hypothetical protein COU01_01435 [Candidatus Falkowbacteria bacterium CG10_big_fil_rev_8_21_14_0_10_44_15]|uniref:Methyltransferase type 11 domain-containing protein n=1 Tax=Candidatus Falkowbacteria bacterium CG10_big_fil_rev_8_21_14_0_10_44_15 TaxID=1974569 RepID=A0A2H0V233_9BACT|nr:MAG: hypothetical protein COU01_01435 [Candidatus Falkowbacteria bacterium CG10_big_fil_rev_8_21_14_0_10_44_15]